MKRLVVRAGIAGIAGGIAMIPFGLVLRRVLGYPLNVYGELLLQALLGSVSPVMLAIEHLVISWGMALPLVGLLAWKRQASPPVVGLLYGGAIWLVVNSQLLPFAFGRPTPWQLGWYAIWPSLTIHVLYGVVAALVARRLDRKPSGASPASR